jgi:hypothetical protein
MDEDEFMPPPPEEFLQHLSPDDRNDFLEFYGEQTQNIMAKAESQGVLFQLLTEWPRERIVAYELATVFEGRSLNNNNWEEM